MAMAIEIPPEMLSACSAAGTEVATMVFQHEAMAESGSFSNNPEGAAAYAAYCAGATCEGHVDGSSVGFSFTFADDEDAKVLEEGTHPKLGGTEGTVHHFGSGTSQSKVPKKFWGIDADWLAIQPVVFKDNVIAQCKTLIPPEVEETVSSNASMLTDQVREYIAQQLSGIGGG